MANTVIRTPLRLIWPQAPLSTSAMPSFETEYKGVSAGVLSEILVECPGSPRCLFTGNCPCGHVSFKFSLADTRLQTP